MLFLQNINKETLMVRGSRNFTLVGVLLSACLAYSATAQTSQLEAHFDDVLGTEVRSPESFNATYQTPLEQQIAAVADGSRGRIGVAAIDLVSGTEISILGDQLFPMASTSKIAIAATFLDLVEKGQYSLSTELPLLIPIRSPRFSSSAAPVKEGIYMPASELIEIMIARSNNPATDTLLRAVGGPRAVNEWVRRLGIESFRIDRDIATLVRDDGEYDPSSHIDLRDSATPKAMITLLREIYLGETLSRNSRNIILDAMSKTQTGDRRIPAQLPEALQVSHKTGSLNNTSSDVGIIESPNGHVIALAIYVTGQGSRRAREDRIANIAKAIYDGFSVLSSGG